MIVQLFAADSAIVSNLLFLENSPKCDHGELLEETQLEKVRFAVWAVLYADDAGIVWRSPDGLANMMAVVALACLEVGLTVSESESQSMSLCSEPSSAETPLHISAVGQRY